MNDTNEVCSLLREILVELKKSNAREEAKEARAVQGSKGAFSAPTVPKVAEPSKVPVPMPELQKGDPNTFTLPDVKPENLHIMEFDQKVNRLS